MHSLLQASATLGGKKGRGEKGKRKKQGECEYPPTLFVGGRPRLNFLRGAAWFFLFPTCWVENWEMTLSHSAAKRIGDFLGGRGGEGEKEWEE